MGYGRNSSLINYWSPSMSTIILIKIACEFGLLNEQYITLLYTYYYIHLLKLLVCTINIADYSWNK